MTGLTFEQISGANCVEMEFSGSDGRSYLLITILRGAERPRDYKAEGWSFRSRTANELVSGSAGRERCDIGPTFMELWVKDPRIRTELTLVGSDEVA